MSNFNDNIIDTINSQILHGNRTLNLISQSYSLINSQQQNLYLLTRMLQSNMNSINNDSINNAGINNAGINNAGINNDSINNDSINNASINNAGINNASNSNYNNDTSISNPFSIIINDISISDISSSNLELNSLLYSSLMNLLLSDSSLNITNDTTSNVVDISSTTILKKFSDIENPTHTCCSITLEQFYQDDEVLEIINCKHYFNCNALKTWLATNNVCPVCRQPVE